VPHDRVRRRLELRATSERVRLFEAGELLAEHVRSYDKGARVEDPAHLEALRAAKRQARQAGGMNRLRHAVPASVALLEGAARRGHNLGSAVAGLCRLLDTWGPETVESAVATAVEADTLHVAAVRQVLEQRAEARQQPPPLAVRLPDDPRVRDLHVTPHALGGYDLEDAP